MTFNDIYPVGHVYISVVSTSPATLFGMGTWVALGAGRVLVGIDAGDADFDTVEETGGGKTHSHGDHAALPHAGAAVADHPDHTHPYTQVPNHVHVQNLPSGQTGSQASGTRDASTTGSVADALSTANPTGGVASGTTGNPSAGKTHSVTQPSDHAPQSHDSPSHLPPYLVVYMWKRTA